MGVAGVALSSTASRMAGLGFLIFFFVKRLHTPVGLSILKTVGLKELRQLLSDVYKRQHLFPGDIVDSPVGFQIHLVEGKPG